MACSFVGPDVIEIYSDNIKNWSKEHFPKNSKAGFFLRLPYAILHEILHFLPRFRKEPIRVKLEGEAEI